MFAVPETLFSTRLWAMRQAVQRGHEALGTAAELDVLGQTPMVWNNAVARREVGLEIEAAVGVLAESLGIRERPPASLLGLGAGSDEPGELRASPLLLLSALIISALSAPQSSRWTAL